MSFATLTFDYKTYEMDKKEMFAIDHPVVDFNFFRNSHAASSCRLAVDKNQLKVRQCLENVAPRSIVTALTSHTI